MHPFPNLFGSLSLFTAGVPSDQGEDRGFVWTRSARNQGWKYYVHSNVFGYEMVSISELAGYSYDQPAVTKSKLGKINSSHCLRSEGWISALHDVLIALRTIYPSRQTPWISDHIVTIASAITLKVGESPLVRYEGCLSVLDFLINVLGLQVDWKRPLREAPSMHPYVSWFEVPVNVNASEGSLPSCCYPSWY